jgi:hypothetical protein
MYWYIYHWWNGDLAQFYHPLGFTIGQLNKIFRSAQYVVGLMALFELVQFKTVMGGLRWISFISVASFQFMNVLTNSWNLTLRFFVAISLALTGRMSFTESLAAAFRKHVEEAAEVAGGGASTNRLVKMMDWLHRHPISEKGIKTITFILFAVFSLAELFTSI